MVHTEDYLLRISQSTPAQLVIINYEIIIDFLNEALKAEDTAAFAIFTDKARHGLSQLIQGLDLKITIAQDLYQLYEYAYQLLTAAFFGYDRAAAEETRSMMNLLLTGWREAAAQDSDAVPMLDGVPQVYAGLTYQKDGLSEYIDQDNNRGYSV